MCWGFPIICTPQSGYYETSYRFNINKDDINKSLIVLKNLQNLTELDLIKISDRAREVVESEFTWERFTSRIIDNLEIKV